MTHIPNELALVRSTIHQADELVDLLGDEGNEDSLTLEQLQSILETQEAGVDLLIELRSKLESNGKFYNDRAKAYRAYAAAMAKAYSHVNESIIKLHEANEIPNRLEGSAKSLCIQNNPTKIECLIDMTNVDDMEYVCKEYPKVFTRVVTVTYSYNKDYVKANQDVSPVNRYFTFTQGKHIRIRRSTTPKPLPKG